MTNSPFSSSAKTLANLLFLLSTALVIGMYVLFLLKSPLYYRLSTEDGVVENLTAIMLLATSLLCALRAYSAPTRLVTFLYAGASLLFFFGAGEEISWGQRILGFSTPESMQSVNFQQETTIHNLTLWGFDWNRVIFGTGLYAAVISFYLLGPLLYSRHAGFRRLANRLQAPIPYWQQSVAYFALFLLYHTIPRYNSAWEIQEFLLSAYLFISFLYPRNAVAQLRPASQTIPAPAEAAPSLRQQSCS
ncbi:hypothetical protein [Cesiribacter andamanensis]|uniref:Uncharacterized protein n=1 Tax=Cesiribacter andamanensis AMV16 TaxID=1279009 RepID=M7NU20_9BACT|nr:hypothetical protein [Cesiribacter andamanensis]EMR01989.1 hypothetical protein ADICEAN_02881 [Cesiribacter andamanensis AMV16]